jgi:hypothetical protein
LAIVGASVAALAAGIAGPAVASSGVGVSLTTSSGSRTLNLYQPDGVTQFTQSDLSSGASNFIAKVTDNGYSNNGFKVQATMSNLYSFANNSYNCNSFVPSSVINLSSPPGLLTVDGVTANLTPVFSLSGTIPALALPGILSPVTITNLPVNGLLPNGQNPISQSQLTGSGVNALVGSTLAGVESKLPVSLGTTGLGGNFTNPDVHATCDPSATGATPVQMMSGTADPTGVLSDLQSLIQTTVGSAAPSVTTLITDGYLTNNAVSTALQTVNALVNDLGLSGLTGSNLTTLEGYLTGAISSVTTLAGSLVQTGNYSSSPTLAVNTSGIPAGTYKGVMTVTLLDQ